MNIIFKLGNKFVIYIASSQLFKVTIFQNLIISSSPTSNQIPHNECWNFVV